jgi:hypothetical protein
MLYAIIIYRDNQRAIALAKALSFEVFWDALGLLEGS